MGDTFPTMAEEQQGTDISQMSIQELQQVKKSLEGEAEQFQNSITSLKYAQAKYEESSESLVAIQPDNEEKKMLVPLTNSLYASGTLGSAGNVLVDVGTGYLVEKSPDKAKEFFSRKKEFCVDNINKVQQLLASKRKNLESVAILLQQKIAAESGGVAAGAVDTGN